MTLQDIDQKIEGLKAELEKLEETRRNIARSGKAFRVARYKLCSYDYWDSVREGYRLLGCTTAEAARKWKEKIAEQDDVYDVEILEVTHEQYNLLFVWEEIERVRNTFLQRLPAGSWGINILKDDSGVYEGSDCEIYDRFIEMLRRKRKQIIERLDAGDPDIVFIDLEKY